MEKSQGGESQLSSVWKVLSAGCLERLLWQSWSLKWLRLDNLVPIKHGSYDLTGFLEHRWRLETGWRSLSPGYYTGLLNPVCPFMFFFSPAFSQRRGLQPHLVLINNTGALSKRGVMAERTKSEVKWKKKRLRRRRKQDKLTRQVSCCETHERTNEKEKGGMSTGNYRHKGERNMGKDDLGNRDPPSPCYTWACYQFWGTLMSQYPPYCSSHLYSYKHVLLVYMYNCLVRFNWLLGTNKDCFNLNTSYKKKSVNF